MKPRDYTVGVIPPAHSMDCWRVELIRRTGNDEYTLVIGFSDSKPNAIADAKATLSEALKQLEGK